jgi:hypothetical protein
MRLIEPKVSLHSKVSFHSKEEYTMAIVTVGDAMPFAFMIPTAGKEEMQKEVMARFEGLVRAIVGPETAAETRMVELGRD